MISNSFAGEQDYVSGDSVEVNESVLLALKTGMQEPVVQAKKMTGAAAVPITEAVRKVGIFFCIKAPSQCLERLRKAIFHHTARVSRPDERSRGSTQSDDSLSEPLHCEGMGIGTLEAHARRACNRRRARAGPNPLRVRVVSVALCRSRDPFKTRAIAPPAAMTCLLTV